MLSTCASPGCNTLVFGVGRCLEHQAAVPLEFVRGRPFVPEASVVRRRTARVSLGRRVARTALLPFSRES
jgi:hypothetical protein